MASTIADQQIRLSPKAMAAVRNLRRLKAEGDELALKIKAEEDKIKAELRPELGGKAVGTNAKGVPLVSVKSSITRTINTAMLRKIAPEIAAECETDSERRRLYLAPVE